MMFQAECEADSGNEDQDVWQRSPQFLVGLTGSCSDLQSITMALVEMYQLSLEKKESQKHPHVKHDTEVTELGEKIYESPADQKPTSVLGYPEEEGKKVFSEEMKKAAKPRKKSKTQSHEITNAEVHLSKEEVNKEVRTVDKFLAGDGSCDDVGLFLRTPMLPSLRKKKQPMLATVRRRCMEVMWRIIRLLSILRS